VRPRYKINSITGLYWCEAGSRLCIIQPFLRHFLCRIFFPFWGPHGRGVMSDGGEKTTPNLVTLHSVLLYCLPAE